MTPEAPAAWDETVDIVVIGFGAAGAVAAIEAADAGASVLLLEKMPDPGGISILSAGGIRVSLDVEQGYQYLHATCGGRTPDDVLRALADGMAEMPEYVRRLAQANNAHIKVVQGPGNYPFPGCDALALVEVAGISGFDAATEYPAVRPARPGCLLFKLLHDNVAQRRIPVWLSTRAEQLLRTSSGEITGIRVTRAGRSVQIKARCAVILACGGFEADEDMKQQYLPATPVICGSFRGNTGDGIRMAQKVGAGLWHMWHHHGPCGFRHPDPAYPFGIYVKLLPMWTPEREKKILPRMAWIVVDQAAQRYTDEYPPYLSDTGVRQFELFEPKSYRHQRSPSFLIFDEAGRRMYPMGRSVTNDRDAHYEWSADNLAELENGILKRADSIAELAQKLGLDAAALTASVARWNLHCDANVDGDFGRKPETMMALRTPPYYAGEIWPVVINTHGGPVHNAHQQVLDPYGEPIPRLYAAGELGGVFGHIYMAGGNLAECFVGGRNAARHAARLIPWDAA